MELRLASYVSLFGFRRVSLALIGEIGDQANAALIGEVGPGPLGHDHESRMRRQVRLTHYVGLSTILRLREQGAALSRNHSCSSSKM